VSGIWLYMAVWCPGESARVWSITSKSGIVLNVFSWSTEEVDGDGTTPTSGIPYNVERLTNSWEVVEIWTADSIAS